MTQKIINSIADDKKDHVLLGMVWGYPLQLIGAILDIVLHVSIFFIIFSGIGLLLVAGKEIIHDWYRGKGKPEKWDFIASAIPILFSVIVYMLVK